MKSLNTIFTMRFCVVLLAASFLAYGGCGGGSSYTEYTESETSSESGSSPSTETPSEIKSSSEDKNTIKPAKSEDKGASSETSAQPPSDHVDGGNDSASEPPPKVLPPKTAVTRVNENPVAPRPRVETPPKAQSSLPIVEVAKDFPMLAEWNNDLGNELSREFQGKNFTQCSELTLGKMVDCLKELNTAVKKLRAEQYEKFPENLLKAAEMQYSLLHLRDLHREIWAKNTDPGKEKVKNERLPAVSKEAFDVARSATDSNMPRLASDMSKLGEITFRPPINSAALLEKYAAAEAPARNPDPDSSSDDYYDDSSSYSDSSGKSLYEQASDALRSIVSEKPDSKTVVPLLRSVTVAARSKFKTSDSSEGSDSSYYSSSSRTQTPSRGGISLDAPAASGPKAVIPETIPEPMMELIMFGLRKLNRSGDPEIAQESIRAYCAISSEDIIPEVMAFIYDEKHTAELKQACCEAMIYDPKYLKDPRICGIFLEYLDQDAKWAHAQLETLAKSDESLGAFIARISIAKIKSKSVTVRNAALLLIADFGDAVCAPSLVPFISDKNDLGVRTYVIEAMGRIGDVKTSRNLAAQIPDESVRKPAIDALVRLGRNGELAVCELITKDVSGRTSLEQAEISEIGLGILGKTGTWNSLRYVAFVLNRYGTTVENEKLGLDEARLNNLLYLSLNAGAGIISRMTGSQMPAIKKPSLPAAGRDAWDSGTDSGYRSDSSSDSYYDSSSDSGSSSRKPGEDSPLDINPPPGESPYHWTMVLLKVATENAEKGSSILVKAKTVAAAETAGTEYRDYDITKDMIEPAIDQALEYCTELIAKDKLDFKNYRNKYNSAKAKRDAAASTIMKSAKLWEAFGKTYKAGANSRTTDN